MPLLLLLYLKLPLLLHLSGKLGIVCHCQVGLLLLLEQLGVQVLHSVRLWIPRVHASHEGSRIGLATRSRHHLTGHLRRHTRLSSGLAGVVSHARSHGVARMYAGMLLHSWVKACPGPHTGHHV